MKNIVFRNLNQFVDFVRSFDKKLGTGLEGTCYQKDNKSYKLYNHSYRDYYDNPKAQRDLLKFRNIQVDNFNFIRNLIFIRNSIIGSGTEYAPGTNCFDIHLHRSNLDNLINALNILKRNVMELSRNYIYINDLCLENIIYNDNIFSFIDTSDYYYKGDIEVPSEGKDDITTIYRKKYEYYNEGFI